MGSIFDAYYNIGLGFKNEIDIDVKRTMPLGLYAKKFDFTEITNDMIGV